MNHVKKYYLLFKWWLKELKERQEMNCQSPKQIQKKIKQVNEALLLSQRLENRIDIAKNEAKLEILNWLLNDSAKS